MKELTRRVTPEEARTAIPGAAQVAEKREPVLALVGEEKESDHALWKSMSDAQRNTDSARHFKLRIADALAFRPERHQGLNGIDAARAYPQIVVSRAQR